MSSRLDKFEHVSSFVISFFSSVEKEKNTRKSIDHLYFQGIGPLLPDEPTNCYVLWSIRQNKYKVHKTCYVLYDQT